MNKRKYATKGIAQLKTCNGSLRVQLPRSLYEGKQRFLSLGLSDTPENREKAKDIVDIIQRDIKYEEFDYTLDRYKNPKDQKIINPEDSKDKLLTLQEMLDLFEKKYFRKIKKCRQSLDTFHQHKQNIIRAFNFQDNFNFYLSDTIIDSAVSSTKAGTAARVKTIDSLKVFFKHFNISYEFVDGVGSGYKSKDRNLPTDEEIIEAWHKIKLEGFCCSYGYQGNAESWGWIFAVIATYGVRPHEILAIDYEKSFKPPNYPLYIDKNITDGTKTGSRIVFPIPLSWVELFDIPNPKTKYIEDSKELFTVKIRIFADRFGERMGNKKIKFRAYDMRHRYAIRGREFGFKIDDLSKWMGHSVHKHTKTYQKYWSDDSSSIIYEQGLRRKDELEYVKQGGFTYEELKTKVEETKIRINQLETELELLIRTKTKQNDLYSQNMDEIQASKNKKSTNNLRISKKSKQKSSSSSNSIQLELMFENL